MDRNVTDAAGPGGPAGPTDADCTVVTGLPDMSATLDCCIAIDVLTGEPLGAVTSELPLFRVIDDAGPLGLIVEPAGGVTVIVDTVLPPARTMSE